MNGPNGLRYDSKNFLLQDVKKYNNDVVFMEMEKLVTGPLFRKVVVVGHIFALNQKCENLFLTFYSRVQRIHLNY